MPTPLKIYGVFMVVTLSALTYALFCQSDYASKQTRLIIVAICIVTATSLYLF